MAEYETITIEKRGSVAVMTINRPDKLNALDPNAEETNLAFRIHTNLTRMWSET